MEEMPRQDEPQQENQKKESEIDKILGEIAVAAANALTIEHFEFRQKKEERLEKRIIAGGKLSAEEKKFLSGEKRINEAEFPNIEVMRDAFARLGFSKEQIDEVAEHEEAHFKAAQEEGLNPCFLIRFYKKQDGSISFLPAVRVRLQGEGQKPKEVRDGLKKIAKAPSAPSLSDIRKIN